MNRTVYYTATSLDGYIADQHDSLDWLFEVDTGSGDMPEGYDAFIEGIGAIAMGSTTYRWILEHTDKTGAVWPYQVPCWVFTHRELTPVAEGIRFVQGDVRDHHPAMVEAAGGRGVWVVGGGDLAGQFADHGLLDDMVLHIAPVTLGQGRPLFPRRQDLRLVETYRTGDFVVATFRMGS